MSEPGHNLGAEDSRALFFNHYRSIAAARAKVEAAKAEEKRLRKIAKTDGVVLADIDFAMRVNTIEDSSVIVEEIKRRAQIAAWFSLPVNFQGGLFEDQRSAEERAYSEGKAASATGKSGTENPYDKTVPQHGRWNEGWSDDQKIQQTKLRDTMERNNAAAEKSTNAGTRRSAKAKADETNVVRMNPDSGSVN